MKVKHSHKDLDFLFTSLFSNFALPSLFSLFVSLVLHRMISHITDLYWHILTPPVMCPMLHVLHWVNAVFSSNKCHWDLFHFEASRGSYLKKGSLFESKKRQSDEILKLYYCLFQIISNYDYNMSGRKGIELAH